MTSKLLKEAIADAKAVRETALANAKIALEEAFTPKLQSMLSRKLKEELEGEEDEDEIQNENAVSSEIGKGDNKQPAKKAFDSAAETDELGAADVTKTSKAIGLEDPNRKKVADITEGEDEDKPEDVTGATPGSGLNEEEGDEDYTDGEVTEEEEATEDDLDLDEIIRELEGEVETEEEPVAEEDEMEITDEEPTAEAEEAPVADDEVDLDEILREMGYGEDEPVAEEDETLEIEDQPTADAASLKKEVEEKEEELEEAYRVIKSLKGTINEVNLLNAKLLYVNKLFRSYNLTNEQKSKVVETLDRTKNVREVKLVYSTIAESFKVGSNVTRKPSVKLTEGYASKPAKSTAPAKTVITENTIADRFKKLANINK
jgi:hypothetical protein